MITWMIPCHQRHGDGTNHQGVKQVDFDVYMDRDIVLGITLQN